MDATTALLLCMAACASAGPLLALRQPARRTPLHPALTFGVPYFLITTGPVVRWLVYDIEPYGIHLDVLGSALAVAASAQAGILVGCALAKTIPPRARPYVLLRRPRRFRRLVLRLCVLALGLAAVSLAARWHDLSLTGKVDLGAANTIWMRIHYASFFLLLALIPAVIVADQMLEHRPLPRRTAAVVAAFGLICVLQSERDVALVLLMIPISWLAVRADPAPRARRRPRRRRRVGLLQVGAAFAGVGLVLTVMQWARSGVALGLADQASALAEARQEGVLPALLGLGSNLFIASRVVEWVPEEAPYEHGLTYVHTAENLLPSFVLPELRQESLLDWFKQRYAPTSQSGYGFGMEAEAYLNFGLAGPILVFALWAFFLCRVHAGYRALPGALLYRYTYTFFVPFSLYCIRGDSLMCVKGLLYSVGAIWLVARLSGSIAHARLGGAPA